MTIKELKEKLEEHGDDMEIVIADNESLDNVYSEIVAHTEIGGRVVLFGLNGTEV